MSKLKQVVLWVLGGLVSLAMVATALFRFRTVSADKKIRTMEIADAKNSAEQQARLQKLSDIKRQLDQLPTASPKRTQAETDAELKRRGLIK